MAQAKTSEDKSLANQSNQLNIEKILTNWDEYLAPAPMGIFIMSQLLICSTRVTQLKIKCTIDKNKIKLIIHPENLCTTLVQIANESYEAFMLAHNNMEKIQLQTAQVPDYVKECDKLLRSKNKNAIEKLLPRRLKRIEEAAADGLKYSTQVHDAFDRLGQLIRQVLLVIQAHKGAKIEEIEELIRKGIEAEKIRQEEYKKKQADFLQKEMEDAQQAVQRTQKNLEEASNFGIIDLLTLGITYVERNATSTSNKKQAEIKLQQLKEKQKEIKEERKKIFDDYSTSFKNIQIDVGKDANEDEMIKLLDKGTIELGKLQEQWAGMTRYFGSIKNHIDEVMSKNLVNFVGDANDAQHDTSFLEFMNKSIAKSLESSIISHHIAATYVKVSDNYIMKPLKRMHGMQSIEPAKLKETQDDLLELCKKAMKGIQDMGDEYRNKTVREIENRVQIIQN